MDKSWLDLRNRGDKRYRDGVKNFFDWAFNQPRVSTLIRCPCKGCMITAYKLRIEAKRDLQEKVSCTNKKRGRGKNKSKTVDIKTKCGSKITVHIPDDIDRAVGTGARDIVNYCGLIMRSTVSFRDGNWREIVLKHGEAVWLKVKDKFEASSGVREHVFQAFVISTMQRLFRAWKARLSTQYYRYNTYAERLSHWLEDVKLEDWKYLLDYFGSEDFKAVRERNKKNREANNCAYMW